MWRYLLMLNKETMKVIKEKAKIAKELHYDLDIIRRIKDSTTIFEADKWLITGRQRESLKEIYDLNKKERA